MRNRKLLSMLRPQAPPLQRWLASVCLLVLAAFVTNAEAAKFDEKVAAPKLWSAVELKRETAEYFKTLEKVSETDVVLDPALHAKWVALDWQIGQLIDARVPFDASEFGLEATENGAFKVDLALHPHWRPLHERMRTFDDPDRLKLHVEELARRGFRNADTDALRSYVEQNSYPTLLRRSLQEQAVGFAAVLRPKANPPQLVPTQLVVSYWYQKELATQEASRQWARGLLKTLDNQRQRILESYLLERGGVRAIFPTDVGNDVQRQITAFLTGAYKQEFESR